MKLQASKIMLGVQNITKYGSTWYIGMDEVLTHYACILENAIQFALSISVTIHF